MELLIQGSSGPSVKQLQQLLIEIGYEIESNGIFCEKITEVVIHFQNTVSIEANGIVNDITWAFLLNVSELKHRSKF